VLVMHVKRRISLGMLGLGIGYFVWYTPYSALAKSLSGGLLPGLDGPVGGLVLLPAAAIGQLVAMPVFLLASGWWRQSRTRLVAGCRVPFPGRETAASACWMALIVGTTTLNFTFVGFSILFVLVMMRIETIVLSPVMDLIRRRRIHAYSWVALGLSLLTAILALTDVSSYRLSLAAFASLATYLAGYTGRFEIMSRHAKTGGITDRRYLVEEHMATPVVLVLLLGALAVVNQGAAMQALREGFTSFLAGPAAPYGLAIGIFYEGLFVFTTLIFLDPREYSFCMPVHVSSSLLAGVAASLVLRTAFGTAPPTAASLMSALCVVGAAVALSYPAIQARWVRRRLQATRRLVLFVCGANTARSPMAEAFARAELGEARADGWVASSAGLSPRSPGAPMATGAADALRRLGVPVHPHRSRQLTEQMCQESAAVYCMTREQRAAVIELAPQARERTFCLDPHGDIPEPSGLDSVLQCAQRIRRQVRARLGEQLGLAGIVPEVQPQGGA
jgi:protein-tyrosine-phosphatase